MQLATTRENLRETLRTAFMWPRAFRQIIDETTVDLLQIAYDEVAGVSQTEVGHTYELQIALDYKIHRNNPFADQHIIETPIRKALLDTIRSNYPLYTRWAEADGLGAYLVLNDEDILGVGIYQRSVNHIEQLSTKILAALATTHHTKPTYDDHALLAIAKYMGVTLPHKTNSLPDQLCP